jgi:predicted RecA/RadA family phage recombinase
MAKNKIFHDGRQLSLVCTHPATPATGDPVRVGQVPGVALTDERADGTTSVDTQGVFELEVRGVDGSGNSAVAAGDIVYYVDADTPKLSKKATGVRFGYALETVGSSQTATIRVKVGY